MGGGRYFYGNSRGGGGEVLTFACTNGKSEGAEVILFEIPSVVGLWIFSGNTQSRVSFFIPITLIEIKSHL